VEGTSVAAILPGALDGSLDAIQRAIVSAELPSQLPSLLGGLESTSGLLVAAAGSRATNALSIADVLSRAQRFHEGAQLIFDDVIGILGFLE
jgi:hypothetical protein